jgi:hypothetical protein
MPLHGIDLFDGDGVDWPAELRKGGRNLRPHPRPIFDTALSHVVDEQ